MRSRIWPIFTLIVAVVIGFGDIGCRIPPKSSIAATLAEKMEHASDKSEVELRTITDFEWNGIVAFGPYTTKEDAQRTLGFEWPGYSAFGFDKSDSFTLIVFVNAKKVVLIGVLKAWRSIHDPNQRFPNLPIAKQFSQGVK